MIKWNLPLNMFSGTFMFKPISFNNMYNPFMTNFSSIARYQFNPNFNYRIPIFNYQVPSFKFFPTLNYKANYNTRSGFLSSNTNSSVRLNSGFGNNIVTNASRFLGYNERDNSYKLFTNGRNEAWCADFVSYVVKDTCRRTGKTLPNNFGSASVNELRNWGKRNNCYLETASSGNKAQKIANNVKPGDVVIFKENGRSHTGIVKQVDANGKITTIEGNTSDKVAERTYSANNPTISGFVQIA